ncbi:unnamed protein product [Ixodes pacificus]
MWMTKQFLLQSVRVIFFQEFVRQNGIAFVMQTKMSQWMRSLACLQNIETACKAREGVRFWCDAGLSEIFTRPMLHGRAAGMLKSIFMFCHLSVLFRSIGISVNPPKCFNIVDSGVEQRECPHN